MSDQENAAETNVQANNNSTAVGKFEVGGSIGGDVKIGGTHITNNYLAPVKSPDLNETIEIEYWEPETILIPAGTFWMGSDPGVGVKDYEQPRHEISLPVYRISKYPVLNREYAEFIKQSTTEKSAPQVPEWSGRKPREEHVNEPVRGVTWEDARDYCKWLSEMTKRNYELPNEAQLEKAYQGPYDCTDILPDIYLWTCTLWGENPGPPDRKYWYPWLKDDGRNNPNANSQIRRVVCRYKKVDGTDRSQRDSRTGQFPKKPLPPERYSFRIVMKV